MNGRDKLITRKELAEMLRVSMKEISVLEKKGLPVMRLGYRTKRYDYDKVIKWIDEKSLSMRSLTTEGR